MQKNLFEVYLEDRQTKNYVEFKYENFTDKQKELYDAVVPKEHLTKLADPSMPSGFVSIKPQYIDEILFEFFGITNYKFNVKTVNSKETVTSNGHKVFSTTVELEFYSEYFGIYLTAFGGSTNKDEGNALKGAVSDCKTTLGRMLFPKVNEIWYNHYTVEDGYVGNKPAAESKPKFNNATNTNKPKFG